MKKSLVHAWGCTIVAIGATSAVVRAETVVGAATISLKGAAVGKECPTERQLAAQVDAELASSARGGRSTDAALVVSIERDSTGFSALVEVRGQLNARRQLRAPRCESLGDALAIALAVILDGNAPQVADADDPVLTTPDKPKEQASPATMDAPVSAATASNGRPASMGRADEAIARIPRTAQSLTLHPPVGDVRPVSDRREWRWGLFAQGGVTSDLSTGLMGGAAVGRRPIELRLGLWWENPRDVELAPGYISRARVGGLAAGCFSMGQALELSSCAQAWLGSETFVGHDYARPRSDHVFWSAFGLSLGIETGRSLRSGLDLLTLVHPWQDRYLAPASGNSHKTTPFSLWLLLRVELSKSLR